jgi:hypothetical protein
MIVAGLAKILAQSHSLRASAEMLAFWLCSCVDGAGRGDYVTQTAVNYIIEIEGGVWRLGERESGTYYSMSCEP